MNESLYDNIVNYILHKEYPSECKKVGKYVLRRTAKKYSVEITPANKDDSSVGDGHNNNASVLSHITSITYNFERVPVPV